MSKNYSESLSDLLPEGNFPSKFFVMPETKLSDAHVGIYSDVRFKYQRDTSVYLYAETSVDIIRAFERLTSDQEEKLDVQVLGRKIPNFYNRVEAGKAYFGKDQPTEHQQTYRFVIKRSPLNILTEDGSKEIHFYANNLNQLKIIANECSFKVGKANVKISKLAEDKFPEPGVSRPTHKIIASFSTPNGASCEEVFSLYWLIGDALTLLSGQYSGIGHLTGVDSDNQKKIVTLGFGRCDLAQTSRRSWYRLDPSIRISEVVRGMSKLKDDEASYKVMKRALHYYRASNTISTAREVALVSSCSGIEAMLGHYLRQTAGWTNNLLNRSSLQDRMTAAASLIGLKDSPTNHCTALQKISAAKNFTPFGVMAMFRNKLVHSDPDFSYDAEMLFEAHNAFQWYLEMLLLSSIGYKGGYTDRRINSGYTETHELPYTKSLLS